MRITLDLWPSEAGRLARLIAQRWPWLRTSFLERSNSLDIEGGFETRVSGSVTLRLAEGSRGRNTFLVPSVQLTSGTGLTGTLSEVEAGMQVYRAVVDALHFSIAHLGKLEVYPDELPCSNCGGSGEIKRAPPSGRGKKRLPAQVSKCPVCNGTGKQKPSKNESEEA